MWRCGIVLVLVCGLCVKVDAQNVVFTAAASTNKMCLKDRVTVQYIIKDGQNIQSVSGPCHTDFIIVAGPFQQQSTSTCIVGDKVVQTRNICLTYILQPRREGTFTIPPVAARDAAGHTYQSNAVTIQVATGQPLAEHNPTH